MPEETGRLTPRNGLLGWSAGQTPGLPPSAPPAVSRKSGDQRAEAHGQHTDQDQTATCGGQRWYGSAPVPVVGVVADAVVTGRVFLATATAVALVGHRQAGVFVDAATKRRNDDGAWLARV